MYNAEVVVVGAGPAGLTASLEAARAGARVLLIDENSRPGGQLFKQIHKFFGSRMHKAGTRGMNIGGQLLEETKRSDVEVWLNSAVVGLENGHDLWVVQDESKSVRVHAEQIILATGATENAVTFPGWELPGVMGAGAAQTMINVHRVLPGRRVIMVGSGNVGVIVSYQLMQAGAKVCAIVEAAPALGGYGVHTAKVRRAGVPFYTGCTVNRAIGTQRVEAVELIDLDESFVKVAGTERMLEADTVCLATGLTPLTELAWIAGCEFRYIPALGGHLPYHDRWMRTTVEALYVAGDIAGVEEASTAMEEGRLAGIGAARALGYYNEQEAKERFELVWRSLNALRCGQFGQKRWDAKELLMQEQGVKEAANV